MKYLVLQEVFKKHLVLYRAMHLCVPPMFVSQSFSHTQPVRAQRGIRISPILDWLVFSCLLLTSHNSILPSFLGCTYFCVSFKTQTSLSRLVYTIHLYTLVYTIFQSTSFTSCFDPQNLCHEAVGDHVVAWAGGLGSQALIVSGACENGWRESSPGQRPGPGYRKLLGRGAQCTLGKSLQRTRPKKCHKMVILLVF